MMSTRALIVAVLAGCSADHAQTVTLPRAVERPVTPVDASLLPPPSPSAAAHACVMLYECGCNAGCTEIDHPLASLTARMQVGVVSGPLKGTTVFVAKNHTDDGETVFTIQRADPKSPILVCGSPSTPLIGYLCATDKMGAARACGACDP
jgi:hypothetical protein